MKILALMTTIFAVACGSTTNSAPTHPVAAASRAKLADEREHMLASLHDYIEAGTYPTDAAGLPRSVFVDAKGVRCPMAELIWRSGHADLVEAVAREHDQVRLADVNEGPLLAWMQGSGLTRDEIDLIQGAADIDMVWMQQTPSQETILARGEVRGRLESAEQALRTGTAHSLDVAVAALPNGTVPTPSIVPGTKVVPVAAMTSGPKGRAIVSAFQQRPNGVTPNGSIAHVQLH